MTLDLPPHVLAYLETQAEVYAERVRRVLAALTPREQRLVREAAVMGYVLGVREPQGSRVPALPGEDRPQVLLDVVGALLTAEPGFELFKAIERQSRPLGPGEEKCPCCGEPAVLGAYSVCAPCAEANGWDPRCEACIAEDRGNDEHGLQHVATCASGKRATL